MTGRRTSSRVEQAGISVLLYQRLIPVETDARKAMQLFQMPENRGAISISGMVCNAERVQKGGL